MRFRFWNNLAVSNGNVRGMGSQGIHLDAEGVDVEKIHAVNNGGTGIFAANAIVRSCTALSNGGDGFFVFQGSVDGSLGFANHGNGFYIQFARIGTSVAQSNSGAGIFSDACPSSIVNNLANHNGTGSIVTNGAGCGFAENTVQ